jgi:ribonuclease Z
MLLLGHFSQRYNDETPLLEEARTIFTNTFLTNEGETFAI